MKVSVVGRWMRSLALGTLLSAATVLSAGVLVGCPGDEKDPQTHVDRLSDPLKRPAAVTRLIQFYEDAMTKDDKKRDGPNVGPLLKKIVPELAKLSLGGELDQRSQGDLLAFLADSRHPEAVPALVKALEEYRLDDKRAEKFDSQMNDVVRNLGIMKAKEASGALMKLFLSMKASWPKAQDKLFYRTVADTMEAIGDPAWEPELIKLLDRPIKTLKQKEQRAVLDEVFWQATAAKILGNYGSGKAVTPLMKVVLSGFKYNVHTTAISALIKIGKPAIEEGVKLLNGQQPELMKYAEEEYVRAAEDKDQKVDDKLKKAASEAYVQYAALIVANIGRPECIDPMLAAIEKGNPETKAIIAGELHKLPKDDKVMEAFKAVWEATPLDLSIPQGNAKEHLTGQVASWYDPGLGDWLSQKALELKGEDAPYAQQAALEVVMKLAGKGNWASLEGLAKIEITYPERTTVGKAFEKELTLAKAAVDKCGDKLDCWMEELTATENQKEEKQIVGIKAAYMAAIIGGESARAPLTDALSKIGNDAIRFAAASAIDRISPKGDKATADKIQAMIDKARDLKDEAKLTAYKPLLTVIYRLNARAQ